MTALQLNAELFRELNVIVTDEALMDKAIKALRGIIRSHERTPEADPSTESIDLASLPDLPDGLKQLRGMGQFSQEEIDGDERLAYILGK